MVKLKKFLNKTINKANNQESFNIKKKALKKYDLKIKDILNLEIEKAKW